ncbi:hypothetical protein ACOSP6_12720 [Tenacibaculum sp. MEBiC06402]|uniref:hypothetical protein n=1 Tax=unclassified Tenacibaculum TaxID=2635139 RepID=UPI003B9D0978
MTYKRITSLVIYFFFVVGIEAVLGVVISEYKSGNVCPKLSGIPICYVILGLFITALISHITNKWKFLYFTLLGIIFLITLVASVLHLTGNFICPQTVLKRIPKCYYALGLVSGLLLLKFLQFKEIKKDLV